MWISTNKNTSNYQGATATTVDSRTGVITDREWIEYSSTKTTCDLINIAFEDSSELEMSLKAIDEFEKASRESHNSKTIKYKRKSKPKMKDRKANNRMVQRSSRGS